MKKLFLFVSLFAALSTGVYADDIWGNSQDDEQSTRSMEDLMGTSSWLSTTAPTNYADPDINKDDTNKEPGVPVGEGALVLLIGGGLYAVSKLRRK